MSDLLRALQYIVIEEAGGCWVWVGHVNGPKGGKRPRIRWAGKSGQLAHRVIYEAVTGRSIPDGYQLHHECENVMCVNPAHLAQETPMDHRHKHLVEYCAQGHEYTPENTLMVTQGLGKPKKRRCKKCQAAYMKAYYQARNTRH